MDKSLPYVFPPALVGVLRERRHLEHGWIDSIDNDVLERLLSIVFFAGLETHEGARFPIRVAFVGRAAVDVLLPEHANEAEPMYRWRARRFEVPRPFTVAELVKLSIITIDERIHLLVTCDGRDLAVAGVAREGFSPEVDPYLKIIAPRPGCISVSSGRERIVEYERGSVLAGGEDVVFLAGPVRRSLEQIALGAGIAADGASEYRDAVRALVRAMSSHWHGGILIISAGVATLPDATPYRLMPDGSIAALLRLAHLLATSKRESGRPPSEPPFARSSMPPGSSGASRVGYGQLLRNAFLLEADRTIEEYGALTAIDGATILDGDLRVLGFGAVLPTGGEGVVFEAQDDEGTRRRPFDLGSRGTRHRAAATWAARHPGSVVFVASQDGPITCMLRESPDDAVVVWRLRPSGLQFE